MAILDVAHFYDRRKVGHVGSLGFRRSSDLARLSACLDDLLARTILIPGQSLFLDMGCADGRVNVLLSYIAKKSVGVEVDEWTLDEYLPLKKELEQALEKDELPLPPDNIFLFQGDCTDELVHETIFKRTGITFEQFDLFYTYLTMHEEFAELIVRKAKKGAVLMIYGLEKILPKYRGLRLLTPKGSLEGALALYEKE
jgi:SAM-dependent methyltransferase